MVFAREKKQTCRCLDESAMVESLVIAFTVLAGIVVTCINLLQFHILIVPKNVNIISAHNKNSSENYSTVITEMKNGQQDSCQDVDDYIQDLLIKILLYINIGITALFVMEILAKIMTLGKSFLTRRVQVFDVFIVLLSAAFQVVFKVVNVPKIYYSCSYIIMARLWKTCTVCKLRAKRVKAAMEKDIEHRIADHLQTRQRCIILENISMQQENQIKELHAQKRQLSEYYDKRDLNGNSLMISEKMLSSLNIQNNNTEPTGGDNSGKRNSRSSSRISSKGLNESFKAPHAPSAGSEVNNLYSKVNPKPRWRRSSTTEYLERRMSLHSDLDDYYQPSLGQAASLSNRISHENGNDVDSLSPTVDYASDCLDDVDGKPDDASLSSRGGLDSSLKQENKTEVKRRFKRQNSCPECMFTQRMKITKYESMLIEDHRLSEILAYDNKGFFSQDGIPMSVLAVHNDSGTYRSQDGTPTTDL